MGTTNFTDQVTVIEASWLNDVDDHVYDQSSDAHDAANITNTPSGNIASTTVQAAINELDTEKEPADSTILKDADIGVASGNIVQVNQTLNATTRATTTTLGTSLNHSLSDTSANISAFNGVAGVTYHCRALGAGNLTHHATNLILTQTGADITTADGDTFDVEMITTTTCRVKNYQRASGEAIVSSSVTFASSAENAAGSIEDKAVDPLGIREAFNATGSAPVYACRAWVNFNGTGTVAIRASGNVSSITDNGTGDYTINFTTSMPDADYSVVGQSGPTSVSSGIIGAFVANNLTVQTSSAVRIRTYDSPSFTDSAYVYVSIFR